MARLLTSLNATTRGLLALLFAALIVLPSFDVACAADGLPATPGATAAAALSFAAEHPATAPIEDHTEGLCPHGHAHPGSAIDLKAAETLVVTVAHAEPHFWATTPHPPSAASARLERPPRA